MSLKTDQTTSDTEQSHIARLMILTIAFTALLMALGLSMIASGTHVAV